MRTQEQMAESSTPSFITKPLADWEVSDVCAWLRAGAAAEGERGGWEKKLSADYSTLFSICAVDGDTVAAMRGWGNEDWKRMGEELDAEARRAGVKPVKLGDRAKLTREIERVCALSGAREAAAAAVAEAAAARAAREQAVADAERAAAERAAAEAAARAAARASAEAAARAEEEAKELAQRAEAEVCACWLVWLCVLCLHCDAAMCLCYSDKMTTHSSLSSSLRNP